jgi:hypothetical protein
VERSIYILGHRDTSVYRRKNMSNAWTDEAIKNTNQTLTNKIDGIDAALPLGYISMKNIDGSFGKVSLESIMTQKLFLADIDSGKIKQIYKSVDEMIGAGWVVD